MQRAVVCDHLAGEECDTDNDQQERVEGRAGDKQTRSNQFMDYTDFSINTSLSKNNDQIEYMIIIVNAIKSICTSLFRE